MYCKNFIFFIRHRFVVSKRNIVLLACPASLGRSLLLLAGPHFIIPSSAAARVHRRCITVKKFARSGRSRRGSRELQSRCSVADFSLGALSYNVSMACIFVRDSLPFCPAGVFHIHNKGTGGIIVFNASFCSRAALDDPVSLVLQQLERGDQEIRKGKPHACCTLELV